MKTFIEYLGFTIFLITLAGSCDFCMNSNSKYKNKTYVQYWNSCAGKVKDK